MRNIGKVIPDDDPLIDRVPEWQRDWRNAFQMMVDAGAVKECDTIEELEEALGLREDVLVQAVKDWNAACEAGEDTVPTYKYDPSWLIPISEPPYYGAKLGGNLFATKCGLRINPKMQVIDTEGAVIPGLYAGWHTAGGSNGENNLAGKPFNGLYGDVGLSFLGGYMAARLYHRRDLVSHLSPQPIISPPLAPRPTDGAPSCCTADRGASAPCHQPRHHHPQKTLFQRRNALLQAVDEQLPVLPDALLVVDHIEIAGHRKIVDREYLDVGARPQTRAHSPQRNAERLARSRQIQVKIVRARLIVGLHGYPDPCKPFDEHAARAFHIRGIPQEHREAVQVGRRHAIALKQRTGAVHPKTTFALAKAKSPHSGRQLIGQRLFPAISSPHLNENGKIRLAALHRFHVRVSARRHEHFEASVRMIPSESVQRTRQQLLEGSVIEGAHHYGRRGFRQRPALFRAFLYQLHYGTSTLQKKTAGWR